MTVDPATAADRRSTSLGTAYFCSAHCAATFTPILTTTPLPPLPSQAWLPGERKAGEWQPDQGDGHTLGSAGLIAATTTYVPIPGG